MGIGRGGPEGAEPAELQPGIGFPGLEGDGQGQGQPQSKECVTFHGSLRKPTGTCMLTNRSGWTTPWSRSH
jgi:hypothetical protein